MDAPNDLPLTKVDSQGAPISVIAACIERFRYQAPTPSSARSQIPAGKFWWLDANQSKNEVEPAPRPVANNIDRGTADRYRSTSPIYESDDESTSDGDIHYQNIAPKMFTRSDVDIYSPLKGISAAELMFSNDSTHHDLKAAFHLDSYAEKLLMKCDLLLKGYDKPKEQRLPDERTGRGRCRIDDADNYTRSDGIENSRVSFLNGKKQGLASLSMETLSEEDSISLNKTEYTTDGHHGTSNKKYSQLGSHRPSQSLNLSDSIDSLPMSPLGLSLAFSADSWSGLQLQGIKVPASTEKDSSNSHPAIEQTAVTSVRDAAADVEHRGVERTGIERTDASHATLVSTFDEKELARGSGQLIRRAGLETIDECSNDVSLCNDDGFEPNLSESVSFPSFSADRPVPSKSRTDSLLYVSSSSEGDFITKNRGTHVGRHWGGVNLDVSGDSTSDKGGRESAGPDTAQERASERGVGHCATDDDDDDGDHSPVYSSDDASDAGDSYHHLDGAEGSGSGSVQDPSGSDCVVSGDIVASAADSQSASCGSVSDGIALQSPRMSDSAPCPLTESDVAPFLKDEITAMLWTRLCKIREQMAGAEAAASTH